MSNNVEDFPFVTVTSGGEEESGDSETVSEYSKYRVVISRLASGELTSVSRLLVDGIREKTGVYTTISYDDEYKRSADGEWVIFVGNVDIDGVREVIRPMRSGDYICRSFEDKTIIGGKHDEASVTAIERFIEEILPASDAQRLIPEGGGFEYSAEYRVSGLYIQSVSIADFDIVVENNRDTAAQAIAYTLQNKISEVFGYWLDVKHGRDNDLGKNICIYTDNTCQAGRSELQYVGYNILLRSADSEGLNRAAEGLFELLCSSGTSGELNVTVPSLLYFYYGNTPPSETEGEDSDYNSTLECSIAFASADILPSIDSPSAAATLRETVLGYSSDLSFFGKCGEDDVEILRESFGNYQKVSGGTGCVLTKNAELCLWQSAKEYGSLLCEAFLISDGRAEFLLVYICGKTEEDIQIDISEFMGNRQLPIVAVTYTEGGGELTLISSRHGFFEMAVKDDLNIYGRSAEYRCYVDTSRVAVSDVGNENKFGIKAISISVS